MGVTLKISGVNRNSYCSTSNPGFSLPLQGQRGSSSFTLKVLKGDTYEPAIGNSVEWLDNGTSVFHGTIDAITKRPQGLSGGFIYEITVVTLEQRLDKRFVTRSFAAGMTTGDIVSSILATEAASEGLSTGNIVAGTTLLIPRIYDHARISQVFSDLAALNGANGTVDFIWYVKDAALYFEPRTTNAAPIGVAGVDILLKGNSQDALSRSEYRNRQHVKIGEGNLLPVREQFSGDGATSSFTLSRSIREIVSVSITTASGASVASSFSSNPAPGDTVTVGGTTYVFAQ